MDIIHTQAVVLRYTDIKEADRMLTLLSPEYGKIGVLARGCRKPKSRFLSATQLFCYGDYVLYKKRDLYILSQAEVKNSFYDIRNDIKKFAHAAYILNLTEESTVSGMQHYRVFFLLLKILGFLSYSDLNPQDVTHVFEIKLMDLLGYRPYLEGCLYCDAKTAKDFYFSFSQGGLVCANCVCNWPDSCSVEMGTVRTMRYILGMEPERLKVLKVSERTRRQLDFILSRYLMEKLEKKIKSREFIEQLVACGENDKEKK